ncbi:MAG: hypothetical protein KF739_05880 [Cryobacterium sp.]|nr:hypothetical protein [Cryobacterium sp.]MBX3309949.1 hypothetical protein [Cryobacterium sp.]
MSAVQLPRWDGRLGDARRCLALVDSWADALLATGIVEAFSPAEGARIARLNGAELFAQLDDFAAKFWDFRHGRERNLAVVPEFSSRQDQTIARAAAALGLDGTPPPSRARYDAVILTGGMVRAGIVKPRYLRELFDAGLEWREGVFLGAFRTFAGDEVALGAALGVAGNDEFDAMVAGMRRAFDLGAPDRVEGSDEAGSARRGASAWRAESWTMNDRNLRVIAAPSSDPEHRRANTVDTYRYWANRADSIQSVLVITTPVYVPYQAAGAIEVLGLEFGFSVETVAVSHTASDLGRHTQLFLPRHQVQELRSAVHGFRQLRRQLEGSI